MSQDLNRWQGIGRLGRDAEIRYNPDGKAIANLTIACGQSWKDKNTGEKQEKTEWVRLVAFGKLAEIIGQYCSKGKQIFAEGRLQTRKYTDKNGVEKYSTEVVLDTVQLLGSRGDGAGDAEPEPAASAKPVPAKGQAEFDDSVPF